VSRPSEPPLTKPRAVRTPHSWLVVFAAAALYGVVVGRVIRLLLAARPEISP
jgi:hypothetical protein